MSNRSSSEKTAPKKRVSFNRLFSSDRFLLIISFVMAFFIWTAVSANGGETVNYPISDVPVTMELSDEAEEDNLSVVSVNGISLDEFKTTVRVKGNSVTVGSLSPNDIQVYGSNVGTIATSGTYPVQLNARRLGVKTNYDIVSVQPSEVTVVVDRTVNREFAIDTSQINLSAPAEYYLGSPVLSEKNVSVKGPEQNVSKIAGAVVTVEDAEEELTETTVLEGNVILLDSDGNKIEDDSLIINPITVDVSISVLMKKTVPIEINYENAPDIFDEESFITLEPSEIEIAASADLIDSIGSISVGTLDFRELSYGMPSMSFDVVMPEGVKNFNNIEKVVAKFDFTNYSTKTFVISDFEFINIPEGLTAGYSSYRNILARVIGPQAAISKLKASEVSAVIDLTDAKTGTLDIPVSVSINGMTSCWVSGTDSVSVTISDTGLASGYQQSASSHMSDTDTDAENIE